jgi:hypothetical protein
MSDIYYPSFMNNNESEKFKIVNNNESDVEIDSDITDED